jgi:YD repeat-containing protein
LVTLSNPLYDIRSKRSASLVIASRSKQSEAKANVKTAYTSDRISKSTDPMGNVTTFNYDANDNLKAVRHFGETNDVPGTNGNIRLAESHYEYDGLNRLVRSRDFFFSLPTQSPIGDGERTTTFAYAPNSECTGVTDDLGHPTSYAYDTACRLSSVSSPGAKTVVVTYRDMAGNVIRITQTDLPDLGGPPQVFAWTNVYDPLNRCVRTVDNVGNTTSFAYDSRENCVSQTDANGNETVYSYDGLSRIVSFACFQGAASAGIVLSTGQLAFDDNDNCISSTDANGNVTQHAYDSLDRLTQTTQADGTHRSLVWSPRSNLIQETDANGTVIIHSHDANDRCVSNHITPGAGVASTTLNETFAYNGCSRLVGFKDEDCDGSGDYDSLGNKLSETRNGHATISTYDSIGHRLSLTYPGSRALAYGYDAFGRCTNILESGASLFSFAYVGSSCLSKEVCGNGVVSQIDRDGLVGVPNASGDFGQGQISRVRQTLGNSTVISKVTLAWDRNGNKIERDDAIIASTIPRTNSMFLSYDGLNRLRETVVLQGSTLLRDTAYGLDANRNRTNVTGAASCSGTYSMASTAPPSDFQMNQYTATPCDTRNYDDNGNLVSRSSAAGPVTYEYDYANRLVQVRALDFNTGALSPVAAYRYDALGNRISKTVYSTGAPATTDFLYDNSSVVEERVNGAVTASLVRLDGTPSRDQPTRPVTMRRGGQDYYFHTDDQGNVVALTTAGGAVVERYDYDDYGAVTFLTSDGVPTTATSSAVGNPYCWHRLRLDPETDLNCDDGGVYLDTKTGATLARAQDDLQRTGSIVQLLTRNNPWSMGGRSDAGNGNAGVFLSKGTKGSQVGGSEVGNGITKAGPQLNIKASRVNIN